MTDIRPEPTSDERAAILKAVRILLEREDSRARPAAWTLAGWTQRRTGVTDLRRWLGSRSWTAAARLPWGGREFAGLNGRGDAK